MELFRNLRVQVGKSVLARKVARIKRKPFYTNFNKIKSIGLVWDASKTEDFIYLSGFHQKMSERNIEVKIYGFFPGKELPNQYTAIRYLTCLKTPELDFLFRPGSSESSTFLQHRFDVLIDINFKQLFPLFYITSLSMASFKVGLAGSMPELSPFDLMISLNTPLTIDSYLDHVLYYLDMINSESEKKAV